MEHGIGSTWFKFGNPTNLLPVIGERKGELFYDEPFSTYLADREHLNAGGIVNILESPRQYICALAGYGKEEDEPDHFRFGRAVHMAVLEPQKFRDAFVVEPVFEGRTKKGELTNSPNCQEVKDAKAAWYAALPPNPLVLKNDEMDMLLEMIDTLLEHPQAANMFRNGRPEVTGRWTHPKYKIKCKIRPDYLTVVEASGKYYFFDLKTARSAQAGMFATDAARLKYHVKMSWYWDGLTAIMGREPEGCALIPVEKSIPSKAEVFWLNEKDLETGRRQCNYAVETLLQCMEKNIWPRRKTGGSMLQMPNWLDSEPLPEFDWGTNAKADVEGTSQHFL